MLRLRISVLTVVQIVVSLVLIPLLYLNFSLKCNQIILIMVFIECIFISTRDRFFNIFQLFLLMMFLFNLSIPFFNLVGLYEYPVSNAFMINDGIKEPILDSTLSKTYSILTTILLGTSIGWLLTKESASDRHELVLYDRDELMREAFSHWKILNYLFIILVPFECLYQLILVRFSMESGYVSTMHLHSYVGKVSVLFIVLDYVYPFIGVLALYNCQTLTKFRRTMLLYLLPFFVQVFTGLRGNFVSLMLTLLFIYSWKYKQIEVKKAGVIMIGLFFITFFIGTVRFSHSASDLTEALSLGPIRSFIKEICSSGASIVVPAYTIQLADSFSNKVPFFFGYIFAIFSFASNYTIDGILEKSYLAQHITYLLRPDRLLGGSTIGTAIAAEFYEFTKGNLFLIFVLSILLLGIGNGFIKKMYKNPLWFYFGVIYIQNLLLSPRGSVMKIFNKLSCAYILIYIMLSFALVRWKNLNTCKKVEEN